MRITRCSLSCCLLSAAFTLLGSYAVGQAQDRADLAGPLRVCAANRRYFADPAGHPVYLTGLHTWVNLQDAGPAFPPPKFNYDQYLDLLEKHNHNFTRLWLWESAVWRMPGSSGAWIDPLPFQRTGPGEAADGRPKFDLTRFNDEFFQRVRARAIAAGDRGIYAGVMLFQGFSISRKSGTGKFTPWTYHPLNQANNVNGIHGDPDGDGEGYETHELQIPEVTRIQEAYVRKMVDTLNDLDNVIFEIGNELHGGSTPWQYHMIEFIQRYEQDKPKQHLVWMTHQWDGLKGPGTIENLLNSPAEVISPTGGGKLGSYRTDPPVADGKKVVLVDTDHVAATDLDRAEWAWKCFVRGLHPVFMDDPPVEGSVKHPNFKDTGPDSPAARTRAAMGDTLRFASRMKLAEILPTNDAALCSTRYCLRNPGKEYFVYQPEPGPFDVNVVAGSYHFEWFDPSLHKTVETGQRHLTGGSMRFTPPFEGPAVLYLKAIAEDAR